MALSAVGWLCVRALFIDLRHPLISAASARISPPVRILLLLLMIALAPLARGSDPGPFAVRGYYLTYMRMPVMGLPEWKQAIDCFAEDRANTLVLWMPGGFASRKFPETWAYNKEHENNRADFAADLIDYAHEKGLRILLGFTPFGYDGVNQFTLTRPELRARKANGSEVDPFGIHCWGWSLCPAQPESQRLMKEYLREMLFEFYPKADGILVESSDYNACQCERCHGHYYDHEFALVKEISAELWQRQPAATILVYPHYFTGKEVPGLSARGSRQDFDERWGLFFTPHSAHYEPDLIRRAKVSVFSGPEAAQGTPASLAAAAREAQQHSVTGYLPSFEAFSYLFTHAEGGEPGLVGTRQKPLGLDPAGAGKMPYDDLLPRVQRFAFREFSANPQLAFPEFERRLAQEFFADAASTAARDLLDLQRIWNFECDWYWRSPLLDPVFLQRRAAAQRWPAERLRAYDENLKRLKEISAASTAVNPPAAQEMRRLAAEIAARWGDTIPSESVTSPRQPR